MRIKSLDGVRGIAILWVVLYHYYGLPGKNNLFFNLTYINEFANFGWAGVTLFFVLSGYLIGGILLDTKTCNNYFKVFYIRRIFRIVPLLIFLLIIYSVSKILFFNLLQGSQKFNSLIPDWSHYLFLQNFFMASKGYFGNDWLRVTWSLAVEEQFYIIFSILIFFIPKNKAVLLAISGVIISPALRFLWLYYFPEEKASIVVLLPFRFDSFSVGFLIAAIERNKKMFLQIDSKKSIALIHVIFFAIWTGVYLFSKGAFGEYSRLITPFYYTFISISFGLLIYLCVIDKMSIIKSILENKFLRGIGNISYFMFLFHLPILILIFRLGTGKYLKIIDQNTIVVVIIAFVTTCAFAQLSFLYFEGPLLKIGKKWKYAKRL